MSEPSRPKQPKRKITAVVPMVVQKPNTTELLNVRDAGALLGLTIWQVRGLIANHSLAIVKVGRTSYVRRATLLRWAERAEQFVR